MYSTGYDVLTDGGAWFEKAVDCAAFLAYHLTERGAASALLHPGNRCELSG